MLCDPLREFAQKQFDAAAATLALTPPGTASASSSRSGGGGGGGGTGSAKRLDDGAASVPREVLIRLSNIAACSEQVHSLIEELNASCSVGEEESKDGSDAESLDSEPKVAGRVGRLRVTQLSVHVNRAEDVAKMDLASMSDPYVVAAVGSSESELELGVFDAASTSVIKDTDRPEWKQTFLLVAVGSSPLLRLAMFDWDRDDKMAAHASARELIEENKADDFIGKKRARACVHDMCVACGVVLGVFDVTCCRRAYAGLVGSGRACCERQRTVFRFASGNRAVWEQRQARGRRDRESAGVSRWRGGSTNHVRSWGCRHANGDAHSLCGDAPQFRASVLHSACFLRRHCHEGTGRLVADVGAVASAHIASDCV